MDNRTGVVCFKSDGRYPLCRKLTLCHTSDAGCSLENLNHVDGSLNGHYTLQIGPSERVSESTVNINALQMAALYLNPRDHIATSAVLCFTVSPANACRVIQLTDDSVAFGPVVGTSLPAPGMGRNLELVVRGYKTATVCHLTNPNSQIECVDMTFLNELITPGTPQAIPRLGA